MHWGIAFDTPPTLTPQDPVPVVPALLQRPSSGMPSSWPPRTAWTKPWRRPGGPRFAIRCRPSSPGTWRESSTLLDAPTRRLSNSGAHPTPTLATPWSARWPTAAWGNRTRPGRIFWTAGYPRLRSEVSWSGSGGQGQVRCRRWAPFSGSRLTLVQTPRARPPARAPPHPLLHKSLDTTRPRGKARLGQPVSFPRPIRDIVTVRCGSCAGPVLARGDIQA